MFGIGISVLAIWLVTFVLLGGFLAIVLWGKR
jgi:hypothetical protein